MRIPYRFVAVSTLLALLVVPVTAQKPLAQRAAPIAVVESVDLDNLVARDSYVFYAEVRMVGRQAQSQHISEIFEAFKMLGSLPKEISRVRDFLVEHADELDATRAVIAAQPSRPGLPQVIVAAEMPSPDAAAKLEPAVAKMLSSLSSRPVAKLGAMLRITISTAVITTPSSVVRAGAGSRCARRRSTCTGTRTCGRTGLGATTWPTSPPGVG